MKANIFVEGVSDKRLLQQLCDTLSSQGELQPGLVVEVFNVNGWTSIDSDKGEQYRIIMKRNDKGKNLIVFDADEDPVKRRNDILAWKTKYGIDFEVFLFPNDKDPGAVETLLETIINPQNQCVIDCWHKYEDLLSQQTISWKKPQTPTCPSEKSKIYGYLEALVGTSKDEKDRIKDANRDFTVKEHWDLNASGIQPLRDFLITNLK